MSTIPARPRAVLLALVTMSMLGVLLLARQRPLDAGPTAAAGTDDDAVAADLRTDDDGRARLQRTSVAAQDDRQTDSVLMRPVAEVVVVDPFGNPLPGATVEVFQGKATESHTCDRGGRCRVHLEDARFLRVGALDHATCDVPVREFVGAERAPRVASAPVEVVLPRAASMVVSVRDETGAAVPHHEVEVQITGQAPQAPHLTRRLSRWTDARGMAVFANLAEVEYVVRCLRRGRWLGATVPAVKPGPGKGSEVVVSMPAVDRNECFEIEIDDPGKRMRWVDGTCSNYVVVVEGETRAIRIPQAQRAMVAGAPGERIAVRLAAIAASPAKELLPLGEWRTGVTGQAAPVVLTIGAGER